VNKDDLLKLPAAILEAGLKMIASKVSEAQEASE